MQLKLDRRFRKNLEGRFGRYRFEVGVLEDGPHKNPLTVQAARKRAWRKDMSQTVDQAKASGLFSTYAGGPVRRKGPDSGPLTIAEVSAANRERLGFNYIIAPFKKRSSDIIKFSNEFFRLAFGRSEKKRAENLLQAIVRNPILRGDYGSNSKMTVRSKGFDRLMIDTAQLFKAIKAKCTVRDV